MGPMVAAGGGEASGDTGDGGQPGNLQCAVTFEGSQRRIQNAADGPDSVAVERAHQLCNGSGDGGDVGPVVIWTVEPHGAGHLVDGHVGETTGGGQGPVAFRGGQREQPAGGKGITWRCDAVLHQCRDELENPGIVLRQSPGGVGAQSDTDRTSSKSRFRYSSQAEATAFQCRRVSAVASVSDIRITPSASFRAVRLLTVRTGAAVM